MAITQKPLNCNTPESSPEKGKKSQDSYQGTLVAYEDIESVFLANIGNWKKQRRQDNKDIYKCSECECRLEVEKKGAQFYARVRNPLSSEPHNWFD